MRRFAILTLMAALGAALAVAAPLTPQQAQARLQGSSAGTRDIPLFSASAPLSLAYTGAETPVPAYYVFTSEQGYVIASADDLAEPVLGYADSPGAFSYDALPPAMKWWLEEYALQIDAARRAAPQARFAATQRPVRERIDPIVRTKWNQSAPYNDLCPVIGSKTAPTGCVATAMAQVINHHKYPAKGRGAHSYTYNGVTSSFDFGGTTFDWANMADTYDDNSTEAQKSAVATLMRACGVSVDMMYGASSSGAYSADVSPALIRYFGYSRSSQYLQRNNFGLYEWEDTIYGSLKRNHPLYYAGAGSGGAHAFVVDGYRGDGYFHLNWGWGGSSDGYFLLTALDPGSLGIGGGSGGFNRGQSAIVDLVPEFKGEQPFRVISYPSPYTMALSGTSLKLTGFGGNYGYDTIPRVDYGFRLVGDNGRNYEYFGTYTTYLRPKYGFSTNTSIISGDIAKGTYTIVPINRLTLKDGSKTVIDAQTPLSVRDRYKIVATGTSVSLADSDPASLSVSGFALTTPLFSGSNYGFTADYTNTGTAEFYKDIYFAWFDASDNFLGVGAAMPTDIQVGETLHLDIAMALPTEVTHSSGRNVIVAGSTYRLALVVEDGDYYVPLTDKVQATVQPAQTSVTISASNMAVANSDAVDASDISFSMDVSCSSGYFMNPLLFWVRELVDGSYVSRYYNTTPSVVLATGQTKSVSHSFACDLEKDKTYQLLFNYKSGGTNKYLGATNFKVGTSGVEMLGTDADALTLLPDGDRVLAAAPEAIASVEVYDLQGRRVAAAVTIDGTTATADLSVLPAGIYIVRAATDTAARTLRAVRR